MKNKGKEGERRKRVPLKERIRKDITWCDVKSLNQVLMSDFCEAATLLTGDVSYMESYRKKIQPLEMKQGHYFDLASFMNEVEINRFVEESGMHPFTRIMRDVGDLSSLKTGDPKLYEKLRQKNEQVYQTYMNQKGGEER